MKDLKLLRFYIVMDIVVMVLFAALFCILWAIFGVSTWFIWFFYAGCWLIIIWGFLTLNSLIGSYHELKDIKEKLGVVE